MGSESTSEQNNNDDLEKKLQEMEDTLEKKTEAQSKMEKELKELKENKPKDKKDNTVGLKQQYSNSQIVQEDGYCFIGKDDNMRHCVDAYAGDVCQSGDMYRRMDDCLIPKHPQDQCGP